MKLSLIESSINLSEYTYKVKFSVTVCVMFFMEFLFIEMPHFREVYRR